jgi:hypothetical protein
MWSAVAALGATSLLSGHAARASTLLISDLTSSYQSGATCSGCGPFGQVTVASTSNPDQVLVTLTLEPGELFAIAGGTGAGKPLLFDIAGSPTNMTMTMVTAPTGTQASWFTLSQTHLMVMADGTGTWDDAVVCSSNSCKNGTSGGYSGTLSFLLTAQTPLSAASFVQNAANGGKGGGLYFGTDIGFANGSGTGDVAAPTVNPVPLPDTAWLLVSGLIGLGLVDKRLFVRSALRKVEAVSNRK